MSLATERYKSIKLYDPRREMLEVLTKKIDSRVAKSASPKKGPDRVLPLKKALMKWATDYAKEEREGASDWTSYTDYQDYEPPPAAPAAPTNYSYLSRY
jgi:hypothetical protein